MIPTAIADRIRREIEDLELDADARNAIDAWLSADREFNVWFLETTKGKLDDEALMGLLDGYREDQEAVEAAWATFAKRRDTAALATGLTRSMERMTEMQSR